MNAFPNWPDDAPATYLDDDGEHDWDDPVPIEGDEELPPGEEPMTYQELAYDLAAAQGLDIEDFLDRQRLRHGDTDSMSPSWIEDGLGYGA